MIGCATGASSDLVEAGRMTAAREASAGAAAAACALGLGDDAAENDIASWRGPRGPSEGNAPAKAVPVAASDREFEFTGAVAGVAVVALVGPLNAFAGATAAGNWNSRTAIARTMPLCL